MKSIFAAQIRERDWVDSIFLVREKITAMAKNGKPYLTLKLMDKSGEIEGRVWDRVEQFAALFERDDFIQVTGKASVYLGKMQLVVQEILPVNERDVDLADFLPTSPRPLAEMITELQRVVDSLTDASLRALMNALLADEAFMASYCKAPAAKAMHHVYLGGLLEHSLAIVALSTDVSKRYPELDRDLLVVGALLHDVGKIVELDYNRSFDYTDAGKLLGHIVLGVELIEARIRTLPDFQPDVALLLKHLILSHHGQYEYGSPKRPKTIEAIILNYLDDLDSKINGIRTHIAKEPDSEKSWTAYHRLYDRYFFKGFPAQQPPQDEPPVILASPPSAAPLPQERKREERPREDRRPEKKFGYSLGEQLKDKNLSLFDTDE